VLEIVPAIEEVQEGQLSIDITGGMDTGPLPIIWLLKHIIF
jgi:hypothetical protein